MPKTTKRGADATPQNNSNRKKESTQEERVLEYLRERGTMTTLDAVRELFIMNPQQRIRNLRKRGYDIRTEYVLSATGKKYGVYKLYE